MNSGKVYILTSGEYSDYAIQGVFSTREKAEEAMERFSVLFAGWGGVIEEVPVDTYLMTNEVYAMVYEDGAVFFENNLAEGERVECVFSEPMTQRSFRVRIRYNPNRDVMVKAARDRAGMILAREVGV